MTTAKWRTSHREFAVRLLDMYRTADGLKCLRLHNDEGDYDLGTFTPEGVAILAHVIEQHRCGKHCAPACAVIHLAWIIEGCPEAGQPLMEALERNHVEIVA